MARQRKAHLKDKEESKRLMIQMENEEKERREKEEREKQRQDDAQAVSKQFFSIIIFQLR